MNVACDACSARYMVPDEKVRGKKFKIRCKHCGSSIIVDATSIPVEGKPPEIPAVEVTPELDQAQAKALEATKERERIESERIANELKISRLEIELSNVAKESRAHKELSEQLARQKSDLEKQQSEERSAREQEKRRLEEREVIERDLTETQHFRSEVQHWREEAMKHLSDAQTTWRIPLLDEDSQKARRNLVVLSGLAAFANLLEIVPKKVDVLGVEFGSVQQAKWHLAVGLVLLYSLAAFSLKFWHSYRLWCDDIHKSERRIAAFSSAVPHYLRKDVVVEECTHFSPRSVRRALLAEIVLPIGLALVACVAAFANLAADRSTHAADVGARPASSRVLPAP